MLEIPFGVQPTNPIPVDAYYGPYVDVPSAIAGVPEAVRYIGQTVYVIGLGRYAWESGTTDGDLSPISGGGGGDTIFTGGTFSGNSLLLGSGNNLELGTAASRLGRVDIRTNGASTVISDISGGFFESQITVQGFGTTLNSTNSLTSNSAVLFSSGALGESSVRVQNIGGDIVKLSTLLTGIEVTDDINLTWAKYTQDYSLLGLLNDRSIPDVGGVKSLIASEGGGGNTVYSADDSLVGNRVVSLSTFNLQFNDASSNILQLFSDGRFTLGRNALSTTINGFAVGLNAINNSSGGFAIGPGANSGTGVTCYALGEGADVTGVRGIAFGFNTSAESGISIGISASSASNGVAIGQSASASGGLALGNGAISAGGISISGTASANSVAIGANALGTRAIGVGTGGLNANFTDSIAIGSGSSVLGDNGYLIGRGCKVGVSGVTFGFLAGNTTGTFGASAVTIGNGSNNGTTNVGTNSTAVGSFVDATASGAVVFGRSTENNVVDSFGFGWGEATPSFLYSKAGQWLVKNLPQYTDDAAAGLDGVPSETLFINTTAFPGQHIIAIKI